MKRSHHAALSLVGVVMGTIAVAGLVAAGCGGDDNGGGGAGQDGATDSPREAAGDGRADSPTESAIDTGGDRALDSPLDTGSDAASDGAFDAAALFAYPGNQAHALCSAVSNCCPALGKGPFDDTACENAFITAGWESTLPGTLGGVIDGGHLTFNSTRAMGCISALQGLGCSMTLTASQWSAITTSCQNVLGGTIPLDGGGCRSSFECTAGAFCNGGGLCSPLVGDGGACTADDMCTYAASGQPAMFCNLLLSDGGMADSGTCLPAHANGTMCATPTSNIDDYACSSLLCSDTTNNCGDPATNPSVFLCGNFADGGGGG